MADAVLMTGLLLWFSIVTMGVALVMQHQACKTY